jgi:cell division protein FtsB
MNVSAKKVQAMWSRIAKLERENAELRMLITDLLRHVTPSDKHGEYLTERAEMLIKKGGDLK